HWSVVSGHWHDLAFALSPCRLVALSNQSRGAAHAPLTMPEELAPLVRDHDPVHARVIASSITSSPRTPARSASQYSLPPRVALMRAARGRSPISMRSKPSDDSSRFQSAAASG